MRLSLGVQSFLVGQLQQNLLEQGYPIADDELQAARYGADTMRAVMQFQRERGLTVDGICGDATFTALHSPAALGEAFVPAGWRCVPEDLRPDVRPVVEAAIADLGTREEPPGSNAGPGLVKYRGHVPGEAWCAYGVSWALSHSPSGCPWGTLGSALKIKTWAEKHGRILLPSEPAAPGDVWLKMRNTIHGHVALIVHRSNSSVLSTIDWNSGNAVRGRLRLRDDATCLVRPLLFSAHLLG